MKIVEEYLKEYVDSNVKIEIWNPEEYFNLQLINIFDYYSVTLLDEQFILVKPNYELSCNQIKIYFTQMEKTLEKSIVLFVETITPYKRKKMIEQKIPFVISNSQFYLPFLALHIRKTKNKNFKEYKNKFSASTQLVYLYLLYKNELTFDVEELIEKLHLSSMTISRALEHLELVKLVRHSLSGKTKRKKIYEKLDTKLFYEVGEKYLCNPIKETIYVKELKDKTMLKKAGLYALSECSMLMHDGQKIYAICEKKLKDLKVMKVNEEQAKEENLVIIQIMKYDIDCISENDKIDPISLIYSIEDKDERIEFAIEEMMEDKKWFMEWKFLKDI